jgi:hypothetical protein
MKVYVVPADKFGCGYHRLIWPASALRRQGHEDEVQILPPDNRESFAAKVKEYSDGRKELQALRIPEDAEVVVVQRPGTLLFPEIIRLLRSNGIAVVVDIDDHFGALHPLNVAYKTYHPRTQTGQSWEAVAESCREATLVTTSTRALQPVYAKHGRGVILDNYVPAPYLDYKREDSGFFGYPGNTKSHPTDLQVMGNAVRDLVDQGYKFRVVGGRSKVPEALKITDRPYDVVPPVGSEHWERTVVEALDVSLCPLEASAFNTAKSRLKAIEAMAGGLSWIGSPREEYRRAHKESGAGFLAETPKQWVTYVKMLMDSESLRREQGEAGRAFMKDQTYQAQAWRWWEAWSEAYAIQHGADKKQVVLA